MITTASCISNNLKEKLGVNYKGPDEFTVMHYDPLIIPQTFDLPKPGSKPSQTPANPAIEGKISQGEQNLLRKVHNNSNIKKAADQANEVKPTKKFDFFGFGKFSKNSVTDSEADLTKRPYKGSNSLQEIRTPFADDNHKRICDINNGSIKYCEEYKIMKNFSIPLENNSVEKNNES
jgi:hypothetical protein